jgi:heterodisulfide reductase subunit B2
MKYAMFLGCTIPVRGQNYEMSARLVAEHLGIELVDIPNFSCCGYPVKSVNQKATLLMAARNLALAEAQDLEVCTLCNACVSVLTEAVHEFQHHPELLESINDELEQITGLRYEGRIRARHFSRILYEDVGVERIAEKIVRPLEDLRIAVHYGCHYLRPSGVYEGFDSAEHPRSLEALVEVTGATFVHYPNPRQCCGGALMAVNQDVALSMANDKLGRVKEAGANAMVSICPFCSVMYEANQKQIEKKFEVEYGLPVMYYPQLLGTALGLDFKALGNKINRPKLEPLFG